VASCGFSRAVTIEPWPAQGLEVVLEADAAERRALCRRFDLLDLRAFTASGRLERADDGREIRFSGRFEADVVQACVVSLEPVASRVAATVERRYRRVEAAALEAWPEPEILLDPEAVETEPLAAPTIDLGEVLAEELGLALDPYPRAEDAYARLPELGPDVSIGRAEPSRNPFAVLHELQDKRAR